MARFPRLLAWTAPPLAVLIVIASSLTATKADDEGPPRLTIAGEPFEMGRQLAQTYAAKIEQFHPQFLATAKRLTHRDKADLYAAARSLARSISEDDIAEMRGIADACALEFDDVLFLNCFYSLTSAAACRQLVVWGDHATDGKLMHARNLDWIDYRGGVLQNNHLVLHYKPAEGRGVEHLLFTWPGLVAAITGTNRAGLTIAYNQLPQSAENAARVTEPTFFTIKRALRTCTTLDQAVDLIRNARPSDNGSIMISDAKAKTAVVVELIDGEVGVRDANGRSMIGNANHATHESGVKGSRRYGDADAPVCQVAAKVGGPLTVADAQRVMRDGSVLQGINLMSVIIVPADNRVLIATGRPPAASGPYREMKLFDDEAAAP